jgi:hypothetical protein
VLVPCVVVGLKRVYLGSQNSGAEITTFVGILADIGTIHQCIGCFDGVGGAIGNTSFLQFPDERCLRHILKFGQRCSVFRRTISDSVNENTIRTLGIDICGVVRLFHQSIKIV